MKSYVKIRVSPFLVFLLAVFAYFGRIQLVGAAVLAAICHELGHLVYYFVAKKRVHEIRFDVCGGVICAVPLGVREEQICVLLGPVTNLVLAVLLYNYTPFFAAANLGLGIFNLFPIYPLDGGRLLAGWLSMKTVFSIGAVFSLCFMIAVVSLCVWEQCGLWVCAMTGLTLCRIWSAGKKETV